VLHTWRGTATCCTTGVLDRTRPVSCALATWPKDAASMPIAENKTVFFMTTPERCLDAQILGKTPLVRSACTVKQG
jgi:hypothetical protein